MAILRLQQDRDQASLPVVAVEHIGNKVDLRQRFQHGAAEERIALALVAAHAINVVAAEILLVVHEIEGDIIVDEFLDAHILAPPAEVHIEEHHVLHLAAPLLVDGLIQGQNDAHVLPRLFDLLRQCADHVGQAARFYKWDAFRSRKKNFHESRSPFKSAHRGGGN